MEDNQIQALTEWLAGETEGCVDLRFHKGKWFVRISRANFMTVVPQSYSENPLESLKICKRRWEERNLTNPFLY